MEIKCQLDATEVFIADLVGILFPHINDDAGQNHIKFVFQNVICEAYITQRNSCEPRDILAFIIKL